MNKHLVLAGGGHAHLLTLANLHKFVEKGYRVSVIGPSDHHYYSGMGPGMLGGTYIPEEVRFATRKVVGKEGGVFVNDSVSHIDPESKTVFLTSGDELAYDVLSFNAGSHVSRAGVTDDHGDIFSVKPIETLLEARSRIIELSAKREITISIVGGGPSAAEIAGNIIQLVKLKKGLAPRIQIFAGNGLLRPFPDNVRELVQDSLLQRGVEIICQYVKEVKTGLVCSTTGEIYPSDFIFLASGVRPGPIFSESGLPTGPDGGLRVNRFLQSTTHPDIFGGGDCIYFEEEPLDRVGVYAVRQNPILYHNLMARMEGKNLKPFHPGGPYLLIFNLGEKTGILHKGGFTLNGRLAFMIKNFIDRRFMRKFQAMER